MHTGTVPRERYASFVALRNPFLLLGLALMLLAACTAPSNPVPSPYQRAAHPGSEITAAVERCDLTAESFSSSRAASYEILDAIESGQLSPLGTDILVGYRRDFAVTPTRLEGRMGAVASELIGPNTLRVEITDAAQALDTARALLADPRVAFAHPDLAFAPMSVPNDPLWDQQWNLSDFGLVEAWNYARGSSEVTIAIIDTGIDLDHPDFVGRIVSGWDIHDGDDDPSTNNAHGNHVAGIAAANGDDGVGVTGIAAQGVRILPIKVFGDNGGTSKTAESSISDLVRALTWASGVSVDGLPLNPHPADIATMSLAFTGTFSIIPTIERAIRDARRNGMLVIAAAGNTTSSADASDGLLAPGNGPCALTVGSIDQDLERSAFSYYAPEGRTVDVVAPGGFSLEGSGVLSTVGDGGYGELEGTSMAVPFVAGTAALLLSDEPSLTTEDLFRRILEQARRPKDGNPAELGFGVPCPDSVLRAGTFCGY